MKAEDPRETLAAVARDFHARGWMAGTAGNLSVRDPAGGFWITASGRPKGKLASEDFVRVDEGGQVLVAPSGRRPSAETSLHSAVYRHVPDAVACFHVHSVSGCLAARGAIGQLRLPPLEMLKAFDLWEQVPEVDLWVLPNHAHVSRIAGDLEERFATAQPGLSAFFVQDHGATVWGRSVEEAYHRLEALEFILDYMSRLPTPGAHGPT